MKPDKMMVSPSPLKQSKKTPRIFFALLFILLGIGVVLWMAVSINTNPAIRAGLEGTPTESGEAPSVVMAFLIEFGIILPVLALFAGIALNWVGVKIFLGNISTARWAQTILFWLSLGVLLILVLNLVQIFFGFNQPGGADSSVLGTNKLLLLIGLLIIGLLLGACALWLNRNVEKYFHGKEGLKQGEVRFAWNLLIPTLIVLVFVAGRPLEQTFIRSLTDKKFAGGNVPNFVGFENYKNLLGVRFDIVDCRMEEETGECKLNPDGSIQWELINRDALMRGFRTVWTFKLPFRKKTSGLSISGLDPDFIQSIWTTLIFTVISVFLELLIGMFIALTVNSKFKGRGVMRAVMLVPWAIPTAISAILWENMLKSTSSGIVNRILLDLNIIQEPLAWLAIQSLQLPSAIMVDVWKTAPFVALLLLAGLQTISEDLYEAASVDGASGLQQFFSITLPLLRPTIAVALVFRTLDALRVFDLFNVLFSRQQLTLATYNYEMLVGSQKDGYASAVSIIIFILISIFAFLYVRMLNVETE